MKKDTKKKLERRLKIIEGQVRGLQKMITDEKYCIDIITQSSAVRNSLGSFEDVVLNEHLSSCTVEQIKSGRHGKAISEILNVYKLAKRK